VVVSAELSSDAASLESWADDSAEAAEDSSDADVVSSADEASSDETSLGPTGMTMGLAPLIG